MAVGVERKTCVSRFTHIGRAEGQAADAGQRNPPDTSGRSRHENIPKTMGGPCKMEKVGRVKMLEDLSTLSV